MLESSRRESSYGQNRKLTFADRLGTWMSARRIRRAAGSFQGKRVGDFGCGYDARFASTLLDEVDHLVLLDIRLSDRLKTHPKVQAIEGMLPSGLLDLEDESLDVVMCVSVLEHLREPKDALREFRRLISPGGLLILNVPSWRGKKFLEFSAFRLGLSPAEEMDDHKMYYEPRDLWPLLVEVGFLPHAIKCFKYKFGLNTFAVCRVD